MIESATINATTTPIEVRNIGIPPRPAILDQISREIAKSEPDFNHLAA